jgi:hypothetical protein
VAADLDRAARAMLADHVRHARQQPPSGLVADRYERREAIDTDEARPCREALDQRRADPPALPLIEHGAGELRPRRIVRRTDIAGDTDALAGRRVERDHRLVGLMIEIRELGELGS